MKKIFMFLAVAGIMAFTAQNAVAQDSTKTAPATEQAAPAAAQSSQMSSQELMSGTSDQPIYQQIKIKFIEGGPGFMATII
ncbi:MAG: MotA/TolQ/ExbB proton channel family protein, partial [Bacteroidales bacterium]